MFLDDRHYRFVGRAGGEGSANGQESVHSLALFCDLTISSSLLSRVPHISIYVLIEQGVLTEPY